MVKVYREEISKEADAIEAELQDMLFGYDLVVVDAEEASRQFGQDHSLPVITNNEKVVSGEEIEPYLNELRKLMRDWQRFQGDYCYVDEDGEAC